MKSANSNNWQWPVLTLLLALEAPFAAAQQRPAAVTPPVEQTRPTETPERFVVKVPAATLRRIRQRVQAAQLPELPAGAGWTNGPDPAYLAQLRARWLRGYDWRATEARYNRFPNYRVKLGDLRLHYLVEKGSQPQPRPLVLLHGWPHNSAAFLDVVEPLAHPERFGGRAEDGFDVVVPDYPGVGFSDKPDQPLGPQAVAELIHSLLTDVLGYPRYYVQGGDWGSFVGTWLALKHPQQVAGLHLNHIFLRPPGFQTEAQAPTATAEERAFMRTETKATEGIGMAYFWQQSVRPQSLTYSLADSPLGATAWYLDKFYAWSDQKTRPFAQVFTPDQLLEQMMVYLATGTEETALWMYQGHAREQAFTLPPGTRVEVPVGVLMTRDPLSPPAPRSLVERGYHVVHWTQAAESGHFPVMERPDLFLADVQNFFRQVPLVAGPKTPDPQK